MTRVASGDGGCGFVEVYKNQWVLTSMCAETILIELSDKKTKQRLMNFWQKDRLGMITGRPKKEIDNFKIVGTI